MVKVVFVLAYLILAPFLGALLDGVDRIISARMQRRKGPGLLQPFYDLGKLFSKEMIAVNDVQFLLNLSYLVILMIAGCMLFAGADLLMVLFILSTADMFLIMAASSDSSPYANMGASREMLQMMAYEPLTLLIAVGFYLTTGSFQVSDIIRADTSAVLWMPGLLVGFMFTAAIKFRKSPFDLSTSHHAHQEMVKGLTTEMSGTTLAIMNIAEYYEMVLLFGIFSLFFINSTWWSWIVAILICGVIFFMETLWDNISARVKWKTLLYSCWVVTLVAGGVNILILMLDK
ncbi:NADH-quinone oxidoreductase subunit H [Mediterraneibacter glycyrrhizinilyticus]|uniref:NADH-quinone oxidoreductase subunit H n=1 Tax=Candidatus Mediterraneibacter faecipullorum TaxID=2838670 RepID=A0A9D2NQK8_9FIRM|nr:complex I subunit 1 family protein [Mediterraneibacter glycyrrhizinilyticus]MBM6802281.1 NADH-quinone oxidoreductase subunit H [Mediterraneibacter glycyrrhizinilyticus]MDM8126183.1 NADH-quinone oxidoreductase subunit H [Mediterraneibacter glycyrrhizinilyticus]MDM8209686.1 NADH-quinone oxidoreductase subunit H [Mediterraneibacter glycyrrhizinilyticus]HJC34893.1 NADH-quinone oxidoreductase subunit H [Candidatus Mediterraneibacter faecipullorum]